MGVWFFENFFWFIFIFLWMFEFICGKNLVKIILLFFLFGKVIFWIMNLFNFIFSFGKLFILKNVKVFECLNIWFLCYSWKYLGFLRFLNLGINLLVKLNLILMLFFFIKVLSNLILLSIVWLNFLLI